MMISSVPSKLPPALFERRIIPAMRSPGDLSQVLELGLPAAIMLKGDIFDVERVLNQVRGRLTILLHIDLMEGIGRDKAGLAYLKQQFGISGIVSTRSNLIKEARSLGLISILRFFVLDSAAYTTGVHLLNSLNPDAVEMLPGVAVPYIKDLLARDVRSPVIASGLIRTTETIREVLQAGAAAISTSRPELWDFKP
jgi:glycerol uptake operon antiterminator